MRMVFRITCDNTATHIRMLYCPFCQSTSTLADGHCEKCGGMVFRCLYCGARFCACCWKVLEDPVCDC